MIKQIKELQAKLEAEIEQEASRLYAIHQTEIENGAEQAKKDYIGNAAERVLCEAQEKYSIAKRYLAELEAMLPETEGTPTDAPAPEPYEINTAIVETPIPTPEPINATQDNVPSGYC
jgi:hypothetical protein